MRFIVPGPPEKDLDGPGFQEKHLLTIKFKKMATTTTVPEKWAFLEPESDKITDAICMDEKRWIGLQNTAKDVAFRAKLIDVNINTKSKAWEALLNEALPKTMIEAFVLGVFYEHAESKAESIAKKIKDLL